MTCESPDFTVHALAFARDSNRIVDSPPGRGTIDPSNIFHRLRRTFSVTRCCSQRPCDVCFHSFPELSGPRALSRSARASPPHSPSWSWRRWCSGDGGVLGVVARGGRFRARSIYFCGPVLRAFWLARWLACAPCSLREMGKAGVAIWRVPRSVVVVVFLKGAALVPSVGFCGLEKNPLCVERVRRCCCSYNAPAVRKLLRMLVERPLRGTVGVWLSVKFQHVNPRVVVHVFFVGLSPVPHGSVH